MKAALQLLHERAAEERMARGVDAFYGDRTPPLPVGVVPAEAGDSPDADALR
jgi:hypothetical protein